MSNSALVSYPRISPNSSNPRNKPILKITPHHMAGNLTLEQFGSIVANPARQMSANYAIESSGRIGLFCEEKNRSWCSGSGANDHQAITIEVANDGGAPDWHISDAAFASLINLCVDICQRNGIPALNFTGNANGNLTQHNYFQATACPGPYLKSKFPYIAAEVNKRLAATPEDDIMPMSTNPIKMWFGPISGGDAAQFAKTLKEKAIPYVNKSGSLATAVAVSNGDQTGLMQLAVDLAVDYGPVTGGDCSAVEAELTTTKAKLAATGRALSAEKEARATAEANYRSAADRADKAQAVLDSAKTIRVLGV